MLKIIIIIFLNHINGNFIIIWLIALTFLMLSCREVYKRICVAGTDSMLVESPTEPKWSPSGTVLIFLVDEQTYMQNSLVKFSF